MRHASRTNGPLAALALGAALATSAAHATVDEIFRSGFDSALLFPDSAFAGADISVKDWHNADDSARRTAIVYAGGGAGGSETPVRYGECTQSCASQASWEFVTLGTYGAAGLGGGARVALDGNGHPRIVWYDQATVGGDGTLYYGECNAANCAALANWTIEPLLAFTGGDSMSLLARGAFAVDPSGHPRMLLQDLGQGTFYGQCDSGCTQFANWTFNQFTSISALADLKFTASGQPRVAFESPAPNIIDGEDLYYAACDSACGTEANWQGVALLAVNDNLVTEPFSLALDSTGAPRVAFYYDHASLHELAYAWCDTNCSLAGQNTWHAFNTGLPAYSGYKGVALALDAGNVPHVAYGGSPDGITDASIDIADCIQDCTSAPIWQWRDVATTQDIPFPPPDPCATGLSQWQIGTSPDLAIGPYGPRHLAFGTYSYFSCITGHDQDGNPIYTVSTYDGPVGYAEP